MISYSIPAKPPHLTAPPAPMSTPAPLPLPLPSYAPLISLFTPFTAPPTPTGPVAASALGFALPYLWHENRRSARPHSHATAATVPSLELHDKLRVFQHFLTARPADPVLVTSAREYVDRVLGYLASKRAPATPVARLPALAAPLQRLSLWRGDITALGVTAVVNAANDYLLGCFSPAHLCIDNVIHAAAGPRLREDCKIIMDAQGFLEPNGAVKVTRGYYLPAKYVLHTVGPKIRGGAAVDAVEKAELASCYTSCLRAMEELPDEAGGKSIAFCCVSTGAFGYPAGEAVHVAVDTVLEYFAQHPGSSVARVVFNVFTEADLTLYVQKLSSLVPLDAADYVSPPPPALTPLSQTAVSLAATWLSSCSALLVTAGAGLSASDGLDYTSHDLFRTHFPGMHARGFRSLYDLFGYDSWRSPREKWGYYFSHLLFVQSWVSPSRSVYGLLKTLVARHPAHFVRTSNADCFFVRHGFAEDRIATPQGSYDVLQCLARCRPDAVFPAAPFLEAARPYLDRVACVLRNEPGWEKALPTCAWCRGELFLCVRGGDYFNEGPFEAGNRRYKQFLAEAKTAGGGGGLVVLEIGAGFNTPTVIRRADEELVRAGDGRVKLVRVGLKGGQMVDWATEGTTAVGIEGDAGVVVAALLREMGITETV